MLTVRMKSYIQQRYERSSVLAFHGYDYAEDMRQLLEKLYSSERWFRLVTYRMCEYDEDTVDDEDCFTWAYWGRHRGDMEGWVHSENIDSCFYQTVDGDYWHESCCEQLNDGDWVSRFSSSYDDYCSCACCGGLFHSDDMHYREEIGESDCSGCYEPSRGLIYAHNESPPLEFFGDSKINTFGFEWEIDGRRGHVYSYKRDEIAEFVDENMSYLFCQEDGSMRSGGMEFVSQPMTYQFLLDKRKKFEELFQKAIDVGYGSHDTEYETAGMHIHISRQQFNDQDARHRFAFLFEKFKEQIFKFSRRSREKWNGWSPPYDLNTNCRFSEFNEEFKATSKDKYRLVNFKHPNTLEVRAFRGTFNFDTILASTQLVILFKDLANKSDGMVELVTWQNIVGFAKRAYPELFNYLQKRKLDTVKTFRLKLKKRESVETVTVNFGDLLVVAGNYRTFHNFNVGDIVKVVGYDNLDQHFKCELVTPTDTPSFGYGVGSTQYLRHQDVTTLEGVLLSGNVILVDMSHAETY